MKKRWHRKEIERHVEQCTAGKAIWMVIPLEGITIDCPVHPEGHFLCRQNPTWLAVR